MELAAAPAGLGQQAGGVPFPRLGPAEDPMTSRLGFRFECPSFDVSGYEFHVVGLVPE
jgi:hypothetical protein